MGSDSILDRKIRISPDVLFQEVSGECVLLDLKSDNYFGLDDVGTRIWQLIEEFGGDLRAVVESMAAEYAVDRQTLERDLLDLTTRLKESGLVEFLAEDGEPG